MHPLGGITLLWRFVMPKMTVVDLNQRSEEWLKWRALGITATDIPVILGLSPYKTPWQLWAEKIGRINPPDLSGNPNIQRGVALEDKARSWPNPATVSFCFRCAVNVPNGTCFAPRLMVWIHMTNPMNSRRLPRLFGMTLRQTESSPRPSSCMKLRFRLS